MQYLLCIHLLHLLLAAISCLPNGSGPSSPTDTFNAASPLNAPSSATLNPTLSYQERARLNKLRIQRLLTGEGEVVPSEGLGIAEPTYAPPKESPVSENHGSPGNIEITHWNEENVSHDWEKVVFRSSALNDPVLGITDWGAPVKINTQGSVVVLWVPKQIGSVNVDYLDMQGRPLDSSTGKSIILRLMNTPADVWSGLQEVGKMLQNDQMRPSFDIRQPWNTLPLLNLLYRRLSEINHNLDLNAELQTQSLYMGTLQGRVLSISPSPVYMYLTVTPVSRWVFKRPWTITGEVFYLAPIMVGHNVPVFRKDSPQVT